MRRNTARPSVSVAVATTVLYEGLYTMREAQRRHRQEEKLAECRSEHAEHHER
jgi:hypothetical protein